MTERTSLLQEVGQAFRDNGMTAAITRKDRTGRPLLPEQAITAAESLDAYTRGGAAAVGLDSELGTIAKGYRADLAVLSGNPLSTPPDALGGLTVDLTLLDGRVVYERA